MTVSRPAADARHSCRWMVRSCRFRSSVGAASSLLLDDDKHSDLSAGVALGLAMAN